MSGVLYRDDAQIVGALVWKHYAESSGDARPRAEVFMCDVGELRSHSVTVFMREEVRKGGEEPGPEALDIRVEEPRAGNLQPD
jgi:hypothetical protein